MEIKLNTDFKLNELVRLLNQLTSKQLKFFARLYGDNVNNIPEDHLDNAIRQCQYIVKKNDKPINVERRWDDIAIDEGRIIN